MNHDALIRNFFRRTPNRQHSQRCEFIGSRISCEHDTEKGVGTLFSFGPHFALAIYWPPSTNSGSVVSFIKNGDSYSSTTSHHQSKVQRTHPQSPTLSFQAVSHAISLVAEEEGWHDRMSGCSSYAANRNRYTHLPIIAAHTIEKFHVLDSRPDTNTELWEDSDGCLFTEFQSGSSQPWVRPSPNGVLSYGLDHEIEGKKYRRAYYHLLGASLLLIGTQHWLAILDERQYCLIQLASPQLTVDAAIDSLKPTTVKDAEEQGLKVMRQGDWFFIPTTNAFNALKNIHPRRSLSGVARRTLEALPDRRPIDQRTNQHVCRYFTALNGTIYVTGVVRHLNMRGHGSGEHATLNLDNNWYTAHQNVEARSLTVGGRDVRFD